jgi:hypothetical protein
MPSHRQDTPAANLRRTISMLTRGLRKRVCAPHSSPVLAELTSGRFAEPDTCVPGDSGRFLACLTSVGLLVSVCGEGSLSSGCGVPGERIPPTLLLPEQEASATPNTTATTILAMRPMAIYQQRSQLLSASDRCGKILTLFKTRVYLTRRCWAAPRSEVPRPPSI